jgi:hypothetical protein
MPHDPALVADVRAWPPRLRWIYAPGAHLVASPPLLEDVVFHSQQAVEKDLKAFLAWHDQPFRKTHSLEEIGRQCVQLAGANGCNP